jgi:hypothetical protein
MKRIGFEGGSSPWAVSAPFVKLQRQRDVALMCSLRGATTPAPT